MENNRDIIAEIIGDLGSAGCKDLRGVVALASEHDIDGVERLRMGTVLDEFERRTGRKSRTVSKSLARIMDSIWESGSKDVLREIYQGHLPSPRPSPKSFIIRLVYFEKRLKGQTGGV